VAAARPLGLSQPVQQALLLGLRPEGYGRAPEGPQHPAEPVVGPAQAVLGCQPLPDLPLAVIDGPAGHAFGQGRRGAAWANAQADVQRVQPGLAVFAAQVQERPQRDRAEGRGDFGPGPLVDPVGLALVADLGLGLTFVLGLAAVELLLQQGAGGLGEDGSELLFQGVGRQRKLNVNYNDWPQTARSCCSRV